MQKKQARVDSASPKPDADTVKSPPSNQKAEKKSKMVMS